MIFHIASCSKHLRLRASLLSAAIKIAYVYLRISPTWGLYLRHYIYDLSPFTSLPSLPSYIHTHVRGKSIVDGSTVTSSVSISMQQDGMEFNDSEEQAAREGGGGRRRGVFHGVPRD